jgi:hypothetical protein
MSAGREQRVAKTIAEAPPRWRGILRRAYDGTGGRTNAVTAFCLHCTGYDTETVRTCTSYSGPLWQYRPYAGSATSPEKSAPHEPSGERAT